MRLRGVGGWCLLVTLLCLSGTIGLRGGKRPRPNPRYGPAPTVTVPKADLVLESISVNPPEVEAGVPVTIQAVISNQGAIAIGFTNTTLTIQKIDGSSPFADHWETTPTDPMGPGDTVTLTWQWRGGEVGTWGAIVSANPLAPNYAEESMTNNAKIGEIEVILAGSPAFLSDSLTISPANPARDEEVDFSFRVRNLGTPTGATQATLEIDTGNNGDQADDPLPLTIPGGAFPSGTERTLSFANAWLTEPAAYHKATACILPTPPGDNDPSNNCTSIVFGVP